MTVSLRSGTKLLGVLVVGSCLIITIVCTLALAELRVGGDRYLKIVAGKDAVADILPPPLYMIEPYLDVYRAAHDAGVAADLPSMLESLRKDYDERKAVWEKSPDITEDLRSSLAAASSQADQFWREVNDTYLRALKSGDRPAIQASLARLTTIYTAQRKEVDHAVEVATKVVDGETEISRMKDLLWRSVVYATVGFMLIVVLGAIALIARSVVKPILLLTDCMDALAQGGYREDVPFRTLNNEVGAMARAVETFKQAGLEKQRLEAESESTRLRILQEEEKQEAIRNLAIAQQTAAMSDLGIALSRLSSGDLTYRIDAQFSAEYRKIQDDFNAAVETLHATVARIQSNSGGIRSGSAEITSASDDLARRTEQQAASLEETAAALGHIAANLRKTADNVHSAKALASNAKAGATDGGNVVQQAIAAMAKIEQSSGRIGQIIGVIDEIAFQTNLLALNAGVEAARAGESGRGFAVVASEVRGLAQRSADAAKEIKALISASANEVGDGVKLVGQTGEALEKIAEQVTAIHNMVDEIAAATEDQSNGLREVNIAITEMDRATQQNAAMVEESTAASHALAHEAAVLSDLMNQFKVAEPEDEGRRQPPSRAA
jgi:methyl-accepting chemotaxis protein